MDRTLANFIRALRASDVRVSTAETLDAFSAVALVGYDDIATVDRLDPGLTTVRQDLAAEANALAGMLGQIQRGLPPDTCPPVMPRLIVRGSTAAP